ncbi:MAG: hypothetical protein ACI94Y_004260 [Maribacter sp.]|jgi:hypothetical protein
MFSIFKKPYPSDHNLKTGLKSAFSISIFLIVFFFIFKPFGIGAVDLEGRMKMVLSYGVVNFGAIITVISLTRFALPRLYKEETWTVGHEVISILLIFTIIAFGCMTVNHFYFGSRANLSNFLLLLSYVITFGVLPVGFSIVLKYNSQLKKNLSEAKAINQVINTDTDLDIIDKKEEDKPTIILHSNNKNEEVSISPSDFYFAESSANYITIHYKKEGKVKKDMLRSTMKTLMADLVKQQQIIRCHRSFIVNIDMLQSIEGDSRGYEITLKDNVGKVFVSRSYIPNIKKQLEI